MQGLKVAFRLFFLFIFLSSPITYLSLSLQHISLWFSHRPFSPLSVLFSLLSLSRSISLRSVWSSGDQRGWVVGLMLEQWVMGLMFDFGQWIVGGRQQHLCFACRVSWVRFAIMDGGLCSPWVQVLSSWAWVC